LPVSPHSPLDLFHRFPGRAFRFRCSPWTGKCIGRRNLRFFYAFLWSLLALILFVAACVFGLILMRTVFAAPSSPPSGR
jgi:hypothetical protein